MLAVIMMMVMVVMMIYLDIHLGKGQEHFYAGSKFGIEGGNCVFIKRCSVIAGSDFHSPVVILASVTQYR